MQKKFSFQVGTRLGGDTLGRTGRISTPHGDIKTPAFIVVGTKAAVKAMVAEQVAAVGTQAVLGNAYHLYLQPGHKIVEAAGGIGKFMNWPGPTFTDSGGFQVLSLGSGFKKVLSMSSSSDLTDVIAPTEARRALVDDNGVLFKSHLDGSEHYFTPEHSMQIQHSLGADIMFAFDELTSLFDSYDYQVESLDRRTNPWAERSLAEIQKLRAEHSERPYQALFGVVQGAQHQDLRQQAADFLAKRDFDGFGIGGAIEKDQLAQIVRWVNQILPENKPRHLLGISEPDDMFAAVEQGIDTFDCVSPTRVARNGAAYTPTGRVNLQGARYKRDFSPLVDSCKCYTCQHYTAAYLNHLFKAKESLAGTLVSIHNEYFIVNLVNTMRLSIESGDFFDFKNDFLNRYYNR